METIPKNPVLSEAKETLHPRVVRHASFSEDTRELDESVPAVAGHRQQARILELLCLCPHHFATGPIRKTPLNSSLGSWGFKNPLGWILRQNSQFPRRFAFGNRTQSETTLVIWQRGDGVRCLENRALWPLVAVLVKSTFEQKSAVPITRFYFCVFACFCVLCVPVGRLLPKDMCIVILVLVF